MSEDRNDLAYWFPPLVFAGLPVPRTLLIRAGGELSDLLDGKMPAGWDDFMHGLRNAGNEVGWPCFLRTGHGSGKHNWNRTCYVPDAEAMPSHVAALVEWSAMVDLVGLPTTTWAVRKLLEVAPIYHCEAYGCMPVVREFRLFAEAVGEGAVVNHIQPYWPPDAIAEGRPTASAWRGPLAAMSALKAGERAQLTELACRAAVAAGTGEWSVDLLQDRHGKWWVTDMAEGERSFRWEP